MEAQIPEEEIHTQALSIMKRRLHEIIGGLKRAAKEMVGEGAGLGTLRDLAVLIATVEVLGVNAIEVIATWDLGEMLRQGWGAQDLELEGARIRAGGGHGFVAWFRCPNDLRVKIECRVKELSRLSKQEYLMVEPAITRNLNELLLTYIDKIKKGG